MRAAHLGKYSISGQIGCIYWLGQVLQGAGAVAGEPVNMGVGDGIFTFGFATNILVVSFYMS